MSPSSIQLRRWRWRRVQWCNQWLWRYW